MLNTEKATNIQKKKSHMLMPSSKGNYHPSLQGKNLNSQVLYLSVALEWLFPQKETFGNVW